LERLVLAKHELLRPSPKQLRLREDVCRRRERAILLAHRDQFPVVAWNPSALHLRVIVGKDRPCEERDPQVVQADVVENVTLDPLPELPPPVEAPMLRRTVGEVEGIGFRAQGLSSRESPHTGSSRLTR
jgi:hypothetical protein